MKTHIRPNNMKREQIQEVEEVRAFNRDIINMTTCSSYFTILFKIDGLRFFEPIENANFYYALDENRDVAYSLPYTKTCSPSIYGNAAHLFKTNELI